MRVLVTGGAGFIGSHLCEFLLGQGAEIVCMDNFITGSPDNVAHLAARAGFATVRHDVTEYIDVPGPLDWVLHLASPASPRDYLELPIQTLKVGALGTYRALGLALAKGARFLLTSTSEVYGDPLVHPQREDYWGNVNPGVDTRVVRIFNTFGPRMRVNDGRAIPAFATQALTGQPLTVFGDGSQTRSFQYIDDLIDGIWRLMGRPVNDPVNIGNPHEMTLLDLAKRIIRLANSSSEIVFRPLPEDDPKVRQPDITRARTLLGWEPRVDTDEGLRLTLPWFASRVHR
ncbi:MAG: GDP-mannose 4,6-dehydratase [Candidatus Rokubacteria bacterium]|nr:GDP-mannose 4,6-dehydratase [Candidatus Rokubacteria bacterium]